MKATNVFVSFLVFSICTNSFFCATSEELDAVLDTDGEKLKYYIPPVMRGSCGGLTVENTSFRVRFSESNCHSYENYSKITDGINKKVTEEKYQCQKIAGVPLTLYKYFRQRYQLFSRFDEGIRMDEEGWYSVTPEPIAKHQASRCGGDIVVDCFAGVGGNVIQFAQRGKQVIAIDIDPKEIEYARNNAAIYGVEDRIKFYTGDCTVVAPKFKADVVFPSPPWGGPDYAKTEVFDINLMLRPYSGRFLFNMAKLIAPKIIMFLPRNVDVRQLEELALSSCPAWSLEVENNYLDGNLKAITAYFTKNTESG